MAVQIVLIKIISTYLLLISLSVVFAREFGFVNFLQSHAQYWQYGTGDNRTFLLSHAQHWQHGAGDNRTSVINIDISLNGE